MSVLARNKQIGFNFQILEEIMAGLVLTGQEVKAVKNGHLSLKGAFSIFLPGGFYSDVKGVPIGSDYCLDLLGISVDDINLKDYRLGTNKAFFVDLALCYKF